MNAPQLAAALRRGDTVFGTLIVSPSPKWPPLCGDMGLDFVFIDTEHIALNRSELSWMCRTYAAMNLPPLVRITAPDPYQATAVLDGGAAGVVAPYVETAEQARKLSTATRLRPIKGNRAEQFLAGSAKPEAELDAYMQKRNSTNLLVLNIESRPAIENLDEILAVEGVDAVLVGPHDLSCSLGIAEQYDHPDFIAAVDQIIQRARAANVAAGIHLIFPERGMESEIRWAQRGANLIVHSADAIAFQQTMRSQIGELRKALGCAVSTGQDNVQI